MGRPIKIKNSRNTKFTEESEEKEKVTRMNIVIASSLHHMIREVIIEEETGMKGFVTEAINKFIEDVADMDGLHVFMNIGRKDHRYHRQPYPRKTGKGYQENNPTTQRSPGTNSWSAAWW
jgi:hypothetical protein